MNVNLKYHKVSIPIDPFREHAEMISHREPEQVISVETFLQKLEITFANQTLFKKSILLVLSDKTRLSGYPQMLIGLESFLKSKQVANITFIIAYGSHLKQTEDESLNAYGALYSSYPFIHPDPADLKAYVNLGKTGRGTPVIVRKELFEHDLVITFGSVSHHYFAGFGGGRKLLFPGLAEVQSIYHNHSLFLDAENKCLHVQCKPGNLMDNPLAEDLKEITTFLPAFVSIHGILDSLGTLCDLQLTDTYEQFENVCANYDEYFKVKTNALYDTVLASCGGYPKDINFIQAHKGIHHASMFVKNGGQLIVFAGCADGIGSDHFLAYFKMGYAKAFDNLLENYKGNGGTALSMMEKVKRIRIFLVSELSDEECQLIGVIKLPKEEALKIVEEASGKKAVLPNASMVIKK